MTSLQNQIGRCARAQWALSGVLVVGFAVFYLAAYRPAMGRLGDVHELIVRKRAALGAGRQQAEALPALQAEVVRLFTRLDKVNRKLSKPSDYAPFIRDVTGLGEQKKLRKLAVEPGPLRRQDLFAEQPIVLSFSGDFRTTAEFLQTLEAMPRTTRVKTLSILARDARQGQVDVRMALDLYFAEP